LLRTGRITIPADSRRLLGIDENTTLRITLAGDELTILPIGLEEPACSSPGIPPSREPRAVRGVDQPS
jgi:AbrB family looped-hinge helix DNA binding protein